MSNLKPTNDFLFKKIFGETKNKDLLKDLLEAILPDLNISKVEINRDVSLDRQVITDKLGILDVLATLNDDTRVNIEMQIKDYLNTIERSIFYGAHIYGEALQMGQDYSEAPRSISIWITSYNVFKKGPYHEIARLKRDYQNTLLTDDLEFHYIQLPKFRKERRDLSDKLHQWLLFIEYKNMEAIHMVNNKYVKKAEEEYKYLTGDEEIRRLAYLREKGLRDEMAAMAKARREGHLEGFTEGETKGKAEGIAITKKETAKKMLVDKVDIETIIKYTGLTKEEIENL